MCSNQVNTQSRKIHIQNGRKLHGVFSHPYLILPWHGTAWLGRSHAILGSSPETEGKEWILFAMFWDVEGLPRKLVSV